VGTGPRIVYRTSLTRGVLQDRRAAAEASSAPVRLVTMNTAPLDGMQFLLCRDRDVLRTKTTPGPCCRNLAYYRNGKLWCVDCKRPRGRLPPKLIAALLVAADTFPGLKDQTHTLQDRFELPSDETKPTADTVGSDTRAGALP